jgi:hypothetical protein
MSVASETVSIDEWERAPFTHEWKFSESPIYTASAYHENYFWDLEGWLPNNDGTGKWELTNWYEYASFSDLNDVVWRID